MKSTIRLGWALILAGALAGCASVPMAPVEADARAKTFATTSETANVYIYRNETFGGAIKMPVLINGTLAGDTGPMTYIYRQLPPGKHSITSKTENDSTITLEVVGGRNYFVWQEVKMGLWAPRSLLQQVDEPKGRAAVGECKLVQ
jgi:hypothetical protein